MAAWVSFVNLLSSLVFHSSLFVSLSRSSLRRFPSLARLADLGVQLLANGLNDADGFSVATLASSRLCGVAERWVSHYGSVCEACGVDAERQSLNLLLNRGFSLVHFEYKYLWHWFGAPSSAVYIIPLPLRRSSEYLFIAARKAFWPVSLLRKFLILATSTVAAATK